MIMTIELNLSLSKRSNFEAFSCALTAFLSETAAVISEIPIGRKSEGPLGPFVQKSKAVLLEFLRSPGKHACTHINTVYTHG